MLTRQKVRRVTLPPEELIREEIAELVKEYATIKYHKSEFIVGETVIPPSGKLIGESELQNMVSASLDGWLTTGRYNKEFEEKLASRRPFLLMHPFLS